jgi:hypothetical protein
MPVHAQGASRVGTARLSRYVTACGRLASRSRQVSTASASDRRSLDPRCTSLPDATCALSGAGRPMPLLQPVPDSIVLHTTRNRHDRPRPAPPPPPSASCAESLAFGPAASPALPAQATHTMEGAMTWMRPAHAQGGRTDRHHRAPRPRLFVYPRRTRVRRASRGLRPGTNVFGRIRVRGGRGRLRRGWVRGNVAAKLDSSLGSRQVSLIPSRVESSFTCDLMRLES